MTQECLIRDNSRDSAIKKSLACEERYHAQQLQQKLNEDIKCLQTNFQEFCKSILGLHANMDTLSAAEKYELVKVAMSKKRKLFLRRWLALFSLPLKNFDVGMALVMIICLGMAAVFTFLKLEALAILSLLVVIPSLCVVGLCVIPAAEKVNRALSLQLVHDYTQAYQRLQRTRGKDFSPFTDVIPESQKHKAIC